MHHFDKNRLVRCYLGASREDRRPNRLTGFDPHDDFPIATLRPNDPERPYHGPYPIVNCALNLNTGSELAKQERPGASSVFTPGFCGFDPPHSKEDLAVTRRTDDLSAEGYRATPGYMEEAGPGLGTAMAISGAGINPSSGRYTSKPVAFLTSILSLRLGWWLGNPRREAPSARPGPSRTWSPPAAATSSSAIRKPTRHSAPKAWAARFANAAPISEWKSPSTRSPSGSLTAAVARTAWWAPSPTRRPKPDTRPRPAAARAHPRR